MQSLTLHTDANLDGRPTLTAMSVRAESFLVDQYQTLRSTLVFSSANLNVSRRAFLTTINVCRIAHFIQQSVQFTL